MMRDVGAADVMVHEIEDRAIRPVNRHEGSLDPRPLFVVKVRNIHVSMLEPGVQDQPEIHHQVGSKVESKNREEP